MDQVVHTLWTSCRSILVLTPEYLLPSQSVLLLATSLPLPSEYLFTPHQGVARNLLDGAFSHDVTAAILVFQNNETAAMLVFQTSPVGVELFSYANSFFCSNKFAYMLLTWVKTLYKRRSTFAIGPVQLRSVTEIALKSPFLCMKRSQYPVWFSASAKVIRYSVNIALYGWFNEGFFGHWEFRAGKLLFGVTSRYSL